MDSKPLIFISCGQCNAAEIQLGKQIEALITELRPDAEPYFAEYQSSPDALSNEVLRALQRAAAFICVMHGRGEVQTPSGPIIRGSVWIEQEIAIVAFMRACLRREIPVLFYAQTGVALEGIRSVLHLNPKLRFHLESEILSDLQIALPSAKLNPFAEYDVEPRLSYRDINIRSERHDYQLISDLENTGQRRVTDFELRVFFPREFLPPVTHGCEDAQRSTRTHLCLLADAATRAPSGLYPGQKLRNPLTVEYFIDNNLYMDPRAMNSEIVVEVYSGNMQPKKHAHRLADFQKF